MGQGTSKAGKGTASTNTIKAEQAIYNLSKDVKKAEIREMVDNAPNGTIVAIKSGATQVVYQKYGDMPGRSLWMRTTWTGNGEDTGASYDFGYIYSDIYSMTQSKKRGRTPYKTGLTSNEMKMYKEKFKRIKKNFNIK